MSIDWNKPIESAEFERREQNAKAQQGAFNLRRAGNGGPPPLVTEHEINGEEGGEVFHTYSLERAKMFAENMSRMFTAKTWPVMGYISARSLAGLKEKYQTNGPVSELLPTAFTSSAWFENIAGKMICPHVRNDLQTVISFFASDADLIMEKRTDLKPGRFFQRFYGHFMDSGRIAELSAIFGEVTAPATLQMATTPDEAARVYREGPNSCMGGRDANEVFDALPCHPGAIYGGPDLAVAYMERRGRITARAVVWPKHRYRSVIYGDEIRFCPILKEAGYERYGNFVGARLQRITVEGDNRAFIGAYLDCGEGVNDDGTHLIVADSNEPYDLHARHTTGFVGNSHYCDNCERSYMPGDGCNCDSEDVDGEPW